MGSCTITSDKTTLSSPGIIFVEARIKDDVDLGVEESESIRSNLEGYLSAPSQTFDLGEDILANQYRASLLLGPTFGAVIMRIASLKVVEYSGPKTDATCYSSNDMRVEVQIYKLFKTGEEREDLQQAEITPMPHMNFDGEWDELVFEEDIKGELIRLMGNMLRFSQKSSNKKRPELYPLILLHGPPGTGKTTLCQGLAQKISIRYNLTYKRTKFIQIKTATLLSKFYSQSAKQVDEIFAVIEEICKQDSQQFVCVLIDEIESIANSRESAMHGEVQDSLRATNALLTGLDRARKYSNVIFLCTSNMPSCLDAAFLDRCGLKYTVNTPGPAIQYEILRGRMQHLIDDGRIISEIPLPSYRDAELEFDTDKRLPGSRLLGIVGLINSVELVLSEGKISGRALAQLPGKAVLCYLEEDGCDLETLFKFMEKSILVGTNQGVQNVASADVVDDFSSVEKEIVESHREKRKVTRTSGDDSEIDRALAVLEVIENLGDAILPGWRSLKRWCD